MKINDIENIIENVKYRNGSYIKISWETDLGTAKAARIGVKVTKRVATTVRLGINYSNTAYAKQIRGEGESATTTRAPWYHHTDNKFIVEHNTNGKQYLQAFSSPNQPKVKFYMNGEECSYEQMYEMGLAIKQTPKAAMCVMTIPVENIRQLG